jgi:hypothetical protein
MTKTFDAVEMQREGARRVLAATEGLNREQELEFWRERDRAMRDRVACLPSAASSSQETLAVMLARPRQAKSFDAVRMKREGAQRVLAATEGMTREAELEYWRRATEGLRERQRRAREERKVA